MISGSSVKQFLKQSALIRDYVAHVFPKVDRELEYWLEQLNQSQNEVLEFQARASIQSKRFHAQGGSIYALYPFVDSSAFVKLEVALQTISDYLDNLCDRAGVENEKAFRQLHLAMTEALDPGKKDLSSYYLYYPYQGDGDYLKKLVQTCQLQIQTNLPAYDLVKNDILELAGLYSELQSLKHLSLVSRERRLQDWAEPYLTAYPGISCWEFAAATGSTLGIFMLAAAASDRNLTRETVDQIKRAYFPWIAGLHILLDYFIDQNEDRQEGDLNFVFYYRNANECHRRLQWFLQQSLEHAQKLINPLFHLTVIEGLLAMYLSDGKAGQGQIGLISKKLLKFSGRRTALLNYMCKLLRSKQII